MAIVETPTERPGKRVNLKRFLYQFGTRRSDRRGQGWFLHGRPFLSDTLGERRFVPFAWADLL